MSELNSGDYYLRREAHARRLADSATNPHIGAIHLAMAHRHAELAGVADTSVHCRR